MSRTGKIVTRFAPSPTGYLHVGGARTALFNWAFARRHGGTFILRMEDTDKARSTDQATRQIIADLHWLGLNWDEGPNPQLTGDDNDNPKADQIGNHGPYFQSQRDELYQQYLEKLRAAGRVYDDKGAVRFRMPGQDITVHDLVLGDVTIKADKLEDFIIFKGEASGGGPTFHFANVVDDATMGVTHVLRAQEHLMNTPKHLALFEALGIEPPQYAHMPLIFNQDGSKMSKRDKAKVARQAAVTFKAQGWPSLGFAPESVNDFLNKKTDDINIAVALAHELQITLPEIDVHDFRMSGYEPVVLLNYLALLGWHPGGNIPERFDMDWFVNNFTIEGIGRTNAKFDRTKLLTFNGERLQQLPPDVFADKLAQSARSNRFIEMSQDLRRWQWFAQAYQPRARTWKEPFTAGRFFEQFTHEIEYDGKAIEKVLNKNNRAGFEVLMNLLPLLKTHDDWTPPALHTLLEKFAAENKLGMGDVAQPLRVALTGTTVSPPMDLTLAILGKSETSARISRCFNVAGYGT